MSSFICPICAVTPDSHSFIRLRESNDVVYFYTCPAKAIRYDDKVGILYHYSGMLTELNGKSWSWIFDSADFGLKHYLQISIAIELAKLVSRYSSTLKKIFIVNPTWHIRMTLAVVWPFLNSSVRNSISFM